MYAVYRPILPSTGVEHCVGLNLVAGGGGGIQKSNEILKRSANGDEDDMDLDANRHESECRSDLDSDKIISEKKHFLATASGDTIRMYRILENADKRLHLLSTHQMNERIIALHALPQNDRSLRLKRKRREGGDLLVLVSANFCVSVVEYVLSECRFRTIEIHNFGPESPSEDIRIDSRGKRKSRIIFRVDPLNRCALMVAFDSMLVIPFSGRCAHSSDNSESAQDKKVVSAPFAIRMDDANFSLDKFGFIRDVVFLRGYVEPTVLFLQEGPQQTWCGNLPKLGHTCSVNGVCIDLGAQSATIVWRGPKRLPHDSLWLHPVPLPFGGALVACNNVLLYVNQNQTCGVSVNCFATVTTAGALLRKISPNSPRLGVSLAASTCSFVSADTALLFLRSGAVYSARLDYDNEDGRTRSLSLRRCGLLPNSMTCALPISMSEGLLFCGSRLGSSLVLQFAIETSFVASRDDGGGNEISMDLGDDSDDEEKKKDNEDDSDEKHEMVDEEERLLYACSTVDRSSAREVEGTSTTVVSSVHLEIVDEIEGIGPVADIAVGDAPREILTSDKSKSHDDRSRWEKELVLCSGRGSRSGLTVVSRRALHRSLLEGAIPKASAMWSFGSISRLDGVRHDRMLALRLSDWSLLVLEVQQDQLKKIPTKDAGLASSGFTICVLTIRTDDEREWIVQVRRKEGVRLVREDGTRVQDLSISDDSNVVASVSASGSHILLRMSDGSARLLVVRGGALKVLDDDNDDVAPLEKSSAACVFDVPFEILDSQPAEASDIESTKMDDVTTDEDEEEAFLYGRRKDVTPVDDPNTDSSTRLATVDSFYMLGSVTDSVRRLFCVTVCETTGILSIRDVATSTTVFTSNAPLALGHSTLSNVVGISRKSGRDISSSARPVRRLAVAEIVACTLSESLSRGNRGSDVTTTAALCVVARLRSGSLLVYRCVWQELSCKRRRIVCLRRVLVSPHLSTRSLAAASAYGAKRDESVERCLTPFARVRLPGDSLPASGVFVHGGKHAFFIALRQGRVATSKVLPRKCDVRSQLREARVAGFSPLHAPFCDHGFALCDSCALDGEGDDNDYDEEAAEKIAQGGDGEVEDDMYSDDEEDVHASGVASAGDPMHSLRLCLFEEGSESRLTGDVSVRFVPLSSPSDASSQEAKESESDAKRAGPVHNTQRYRPCTAHKIEYLGTHSAPPPINGQRLGPFVPTYAVIVSREASTKERQGADLNDAEDRDENVNADTAAKEDEDDDDDEEKDPPMHDGQSNEFGHFPRQLSLASGRVFEIRLMQSERWNVVSRKTLGPLEHAISMKVISFGKGDASHPYLAVGTAIFDEKGEHARTTGRLILYRIAYEKKGDSVVPELRLVYDKSLRGPVSCIDQFQDEEGHVVFALGSKIFVYSWTGRIMKPRAFFDSQTYVHSLSVLKNFLMISDCEHGIQFLHYNNENHCVKVLARDFRPMNVYASDFLLRGTKMAILASDAQRNIQVKMIDHSLSKHITTQGEMFGLKTHADFNLGSRVNCFARHIVRSSGGGAQSEITSANFFGTLDGGVGGLVPIKENVYKRLERLELAMTHVLEHEGGFNPEAFRTFRAHGLPLRSSRRGIIDGALIWRYTALTRSEQESLAETIKTKRRRILRNLRDIEASMGPFS